MSRRCNAAASLLGGAFFHMLAHALSAGNFLYIAAADFIREVKRAELLRVTGIRYVLFVLGDMLLPKATL